MEDKGQNRESKSLSKESPNDNFVLEKSIFSNIFDKDIRRVYIYKKTERLARGVHLIAPAFAQSEALRKRADEIAMALIDAAVLPPLAARAALSRELLSLSSLLSIGRTGGLLSHMNADLMSRESHLLLEEIANYEEPRLSLGESRTIAELAKASPAKKEMQAPKALKIPMKTALPVDEYSQGHLSDSGGKTDRRDSILSVLKDKGPSYIKDISTVVRGVSEKTIQRELQTLVGQGTVVRQGKRRWTRYSLTS